MKLRFINADKLIEGISLVCDELGFELSDGSDTISVNVEEDAQPSVAVSIDGSNARIKYGGGKARFFRGLAVLCDGLKKGMSGVIADEKPLFDTDGAMVDMSRNAVMNPATVRLMLRKMALMGLNTFMLYTEDTYEVEGRPYFGYMRGRYTKEEIRDLDNYAKIFGIELIPCIQTLGHLATYLHWPENGAYRDTSRVLLVGEEETYKFIEDLVSSIEDCFSSRRIHIGMDETNDLGTGKSLEKNGYHERSGLYLEHLARVTEIVKKHGFTPMLWSDMFFRLSGKDLPGYTDYDERTVITDEVKEKFPKGVQCVFWDYYRANERFYSTNIEKHRQLCDDVIFAGGIWSWSGHSIHFSRSIRNTRCALNAAKQQNVKEVIATIWHNGCEASLIMSLAGLAFYAEYDYCGEWNEERIRSCFARTCFADYDSILLTECIEYPYKGERIGSASRLLLYNDPLTGLIDRQVKGLDTVGYYRSATEKLREAQKLSGMFEPAYAVVTALSSLLENKADFGVRLKAAYDSNDRNTLAGLADECDVITEKITILRKLHRSTWMKYNKPFGWEVHDIRYGGLIARFETAKERINDYLSGSIESIDELNEVRLRFDGASGDDICPFGGGSVWTQYREIVTAGIL